MILSLCCRYRAGIARDAERIPWLQRPQRREGRTWRSTIKSHRRLQYCESLVSLAAFNFTIGAPHQSILRLYISVARRPLRGGVHAANDPREPQQGASFVRSEWWWKKRLVFDRIILATSPPPSAMTEKRIQSAETCQFQPPLKRVFIFIASQHHLETLSHSFFLYIETDLIDSLPEFACSCALSYRNHFVFLLVQLN